MAPATGVCAVLSGAAPHRHRPALGVVASHAGQLRLLLPGVAAEVGAAPRLLGRVLISGLRWGRAAPGLALLVLGLLCHRALYARLGCFPLGARRRLPVRVRDERLRGVGALLCPFLAGLRVALRVLWLLPWPVMA